MNDGGTSRRGPAGFVLVRAEEPRDHDAVHALLAAAFETPAEARLVEALRRRARPLVSLVADEEGAILGHIMFSPVTLTGTGVEIMGLAPMAVAPARQGTGIGSSMVRAGLARCAELGVDAVVVLGHPDYYPRFGFSPASGYGIGCELDVPDDAFLAIELRPACLNGAAGTARYHAAFKDL